ncbi:MAG: hypothetical protein IJ468_04960 [Lachnospiraceae bacterium]|nr:hypothetical protein [Lachnospiraceae bacterium]
MDTCRIETEDEVRAYLGNLKYALQNGASITFQSQRNVDSTREMRYTNKYTVADLFPNEDPVKALKRELQNLRVENYLRTVKDSRFPNRSEMREFGKVYNGVEEVYIKIRVELLNSHLGTHTVFVMSFHYAVKPFREEIFPYRRR